jgi:hypothetical protein
VPFTLAIKLLHIIANANDGDFNKDMKISIDTAWQNYLKLVCVCAFMYV